MYGGGESKTRRKMEVGRKKGNSKAKKRNDTRFIIIGIHIKLSTHMKNILKVYKQRKKTLRHKVSKYEISLMS